MTAKRDRKLSPQVILVAPFVIQICATVGVVGFLIVFLFRLKRFKIELTRSI